MKFENIRIEKIHSVLKYIPNIKKWRAENRKNHFIGIMLSVSAYHKFDYQDFVLERNCIYFFNQRDNYDVDVYNPGESFSVHFTTYEEIDTDSFCIPTKNPDEIVAMLHKAEQLKNGSDDNELELFATLYKLLHMLSKARQKEYFPQDLRIQSAKGYIDEKFKESDCLHRAVEKSGLSARRFNDLFKGLFGMTPNRYIIHRRIEHAKSMLETKSLTIIEISELCGFSDVYYFSKVFKQICGIPPSKWK